MDGNKKENFQKHGSQKSSGQTNVLIPALTRMKERNQSQKQSNTCSIQFQIDKNIGFLRKKQRQEKDPEHSADARNVDRPLSHGNHKYIQKNAYQRTGKKYEAHEKRKFIRLDRFNISLYRSIGRRRNRINGLAWVIYHCMT